MRRKRRNKHQAKRAKRPQDDTDQEGVEDRDKKKIEPANKNKAKAVLIVPYTMGSVLAKRLRDAEETLLQTTGYKLKIVERSGSKLEDLLHKSDPDTNKVRQCLTKTGPVVRYVDIQKINNPLPVLTTYNKGFDPERDQHEQKCRAEPLGTEALMDQTEQHCQEEPLCRCVGKMSTEEATDQVVPSWNNSS